MRDQSGHALKLISTAPKFCSKKWPLHNSEGTASESFPKGSIQTHSCNRAPNVQGGTLSFFLSRTAECRARLAAANVTSRARREKSQTRASDKAVLIEGSKQTPRGERARLSRTEHTKHRDKRNAAAAAHGQGRGAPAAKIRTPTHVHVVSMRARSGQTTPPFSDPKPEAVRCCPHPEASGRET